jgi:hypothetical protein
MAIETFRVLELSGLARVDFFLERSEIESIVMFMEGVTDGRRLIALGERALKLGKPILVWKVGNSDVGRQAAASHTARMTASYELFQTAFRQGGFVEVRDMDDLIDVMKIFRYSKPEGPHLGLSVDDQRYDLSAAGPQFSDVSSWLALSDPVAAVHAALPRVRAFPLADDVKLLAPVDTQEVWASGVTYLRSREARTAESEVKDIYLTLDGQTGHALQQAHHAEAQEDRDAEWQPGAERRRQSGQWKAQQETHEQAQQEADHGSHELGRRELLDPFDQPTGRHDRQVRQDRETHHDPGDHPGREQGAGVVVSPKQAVAGGGDGEADHAAERGPQETDVTDQGVLGESTG